MSTHTSHHIQLRRPKQRPYHLHIGRAILASLALVAVAILHVPTSGPIAERPSTSHVLPYATAISINDLLAWNNSARVQNSLGPLALNSKLNVAAQLKANDMINKDYWAHVAPDGTQPWYWFAQAGYDYVSAGENLAYGFLTSDSVTSGWLNSAGHRANILGNYQDVGYGIASGENYQGSQNTVVVAHYGTARSVAPAATAPTPATPATPTPAASSRTAPAPTPTPAAPSAPIATTPSPLTTPTTNQPESPTTPSPPAAQLPQSSQAPSLVDHIDQPSLATSDASNVATGVTTIAVASKNTTVPVWQQLLAGKASLIVLISLTILATVSLGYVATHVSLVKHATLLSEQYVLHHPLIDASIAIGASLLVLMTTVGHIG